MNPPKIVPIKIDNGSLVSLARFMENDVNIKESGCSVYVIVVRPIKVSGNVKPQSDVTLYEAIEAS